MNTHWLQKRFQTFQEEEEEEEEVGNRTPNVATAFHVSWYHPCGSFSPVSFESLGELRSDLIQVLGEQLSHPRLRLVCLWVF